MEVDQCEEPVATAAELPLKPAEEPQQDHIQEQAEGPNSGNRENKDSLESNEDEQNEQDTKDACDDDDQQQVQQQMEDVNDNDGGSDNVQDDAVTLHSWVKVLIRGPATDWKTIEIDQFGDFCHTQKAVFEALQHDQAMLETKQPQDIQLNLVGGGIVERNMAILEGDKLVASLYEAPPSRIKGKREKKQKKKADKDKPKKTAGFVPQPMIRTEIAAYDPSLSYADNEPEARDKVRYMQSQQVFTHHPASQPTARLQAALARQQFALKQMDFNHLECLVLAQGNEDHHQLVRAVNMEWAQPLGFILKMKRSPKENLKGHKTVKLYCSVGRCNTTKADIEMIEESTGFKEELCHFSLSFRYIAQSRTWILNTQYAIDTMWHTHPFFHSYRQVSPSSSSAKSYSMALRYDPRRTSVQSPGKAHCESASHTMSYLKSYKQSLSKLNQIDIVLNAKANGAIPSNEKQSKFNGNLSPVKDNKLIGGRSYPDGLGKREEDEETEEIQARMLVPPNQTQADILLDFKKFFLKLSELRDTLKEQGEEDTFTIQFEENANNSTTNLFYQTPQMKIEYDRYQDFVFLNKRLQKTRFRRNIVFFCGINAEGKTVVFGVALLKEDGPLAHKFAIQSFLEIVKNQPGCFIIERCSTTRSTFKQYFPNLRLYYCNYSLHKTVKTQLKGISQRAVFKDKTMKVVRRLMHLPATTNAQKLEEEFKRCKEMLDSIPSEDECQKGIHDIRTLFQKILDEQKYWALPAIMREFTAGANIQSRNEMLKIQLAKDVLFGARVDLTPIEDACSYLLDFGWLHKCQEREACESTPLKVESNTNQQMLPLTYEEFKLTKSCQMENLDIITKYLRLVMSPYALERSRYNIVQALKYWRQVQHDPTSKISLIKHFPPNANRDMTRQGVPVPHGETWGRAFKVVELCGKYVFCTCMEYFNTGLPCIHQFHVALKRNLYLIFNERWAKQFERLAQDHPGSLPKIRSQNLREQKYVYQKMLTFGSADGAGLSISASEICIACPLLLIEDNSSPSKKESQVKEGEVKEIEPPLILGKSFLLSENQRVFKNTDGGNIPWMGSNSSSSTAAAVKRSNTIDDPVEFFENAAKLPTKKEPQMLPGVKSKNIDQTAKNVLSGHKQRRPVPTSTSNSGAVAGKKRGRPTGTQKTNQVERQLRACNAAKKDIKEANKQAKQQQDAILQAKQQKDANLLQQNQKKMAELKERILKNKEMQAKKLLEEGGEQAKNTAMAVLAPTMAPPKEKEEEKQEAPKESRQQKKMRALKEKAEAKQQAIKEKAEAKEKAAKDKAAGKKAPRPAVKKSDEEKKSKPTAAERLKTSNNLGIPGSNIVQEVLTPLKPVSSQTALMEHQMKQQENRDRIKLVKDRLKSKNTSASNPQLPPRQQETTVQPLTKAPETTKIPSVEEKATQPTGENVVVKSRASSQGSLKRGAGTPKGGSGIQGLKRPTIEAKSPSEQQASAVAKTTSSFKRPTFKTPTKLQMGGAAAAQKRDESKTGLAVKSAIGLKSSRPNRFSMNQEKASSILSGKTPGLAQSLSTSSSLLTKKLDKKN